MDKQTNVAFEGIFEQNKRRIHYQIHKLRIGDPYPDTRKVFVPCGTLIEHIN